MTSIPRLPQKILAVCIGLSGLIGAVIVLSSMEVPTQGYLLSRTPFSAAPEEVIETPVAQVTPLPEEPIPLLTRTAYPVDYVPIWGAMRSAEEWDRTYTEIPQNEWQPLPQYDRAVLETPMADLVKPLTKANIAKITTKLTYSTRFFGRYNLDSSEFTGSHAGVDIKLPAGTPVSAIGNGLIETVSRDPVLGIYVVIAHRTEDGLMYSVYGHLQEALVEADSIVEAGTPIGLVGRTGSTSSPHLHLQVDKDDGTHPHVTARFTQTPTRSEALARTLHPIWFIETYK